MSVKKPAMEMGARGGVYNIIEPAERPFLFVISQLSMFCVSLAAKVAKM